MDIIPQNECNHNGLNDLLKNFFIYFYMHGNGTEWIDYDLPPPSVLKHVNTGIFIGWALDGYFGTNKGETYLNDIIARYLITFKDQKAQRLPYKPQEQLLDSKTHLDYTKHKLREFQGLKSIVRAASVAQRADTKKDHVFYAIKFFCEDLIIQQGFPTYSQLLEFAQQNFEHKENSTLKAKCRSIFNWYEARDFTIPKKKIYENLNNYWESTKMTRIENMKQMNKERNETSKAKVLGAITELKHLNKKITGNAIARITKQNVKTARKWLKEIKINNPQLLV